jgi:hypothetical protein
LALEIGSGVFPDWRVMYFLDLTSQMPRCSSIALITWRSSIALMTRIFP